VHSTLVIVLACTNNKILAFSYGHISGLKEHFTSEMLGLDIGNPELFNRHASSEHMVKVMCRIIPKLVAVLPHWTWWPMGTCANGDEVSSLLCYCISTGHQRWCSLGDKIGMIAAWCDSDVICIWTGIVASSEIDIATVCMLSRYFCCIKWLI